MFAIHSKLDVAGLLDEVGKLEFAKDSTGVHMAFDQCTRRVAGLGKLLDAAVVEISAARGFPALNVMVVKMPPGADTTVHRDWIPWVPGKDGPPMVERWHLPLATNDACFYRDPDGEHHMAVGHWHGPVRYWEEHRAWNHGQSERVHVIVDLDS